MLPRGGPLSAPKSVTKLSYKNGKTEVSYTSDVDAAGYYIHELSRAAMRDVGKFAARVFRNTYYEHFKKHTGNAGKATRYKVISGPKTQYPRVQIGLPTGKADGFYAYFQEFGTHDGKVPRLGLLTHAVQDNVGEIVKIESQYLDGLNEEAARLAAEVNEGDYDGDADE